MAIIVEDPEDLLDVLESAASCVRYDEKKLAKRLDAYAQSVLDQVERRAESIRQAVRNSLTGKGE